MCNVAFKLVLEKQSIVGITSNDFVARRNEIKDLKKHIEGHRCNELSSLALKNLKENNGKCRRNFHYQVIFKSFKFM